jgi:hypothetical protein
MMDVGGGNIKEIILLTGHEYSVLKDMKDDMCEWSKPELCPAGICALVRVGLRVLGDVYILVWCCWVGRLLRSSQARLYKIGYSTCIATSIKNLNETITIQKNLAKQYI